MNSTSIVITDVSLRYLILLGLLSFVFAISILARLRSYLGLTRQGAVSLGAGTLLACVLVEAMDLTEITRHSRYGRDFDEAVPIIFSRGFAMLFGVIFAVKLYRVWMSGLASDEERLVGAAGIRAWLRPRNLLLVLFLAMNLSVGFNLRFASMLILGLAALLAYPFFSAIMNSTPVSETPSTPVRPVSEAPSSPEREKVLGMLEAGKITAEECAEILNALGGGGAATTGAIRRALPRPMILVGAALIAVSFFLPWFAVNLGQEVNRMTSQLQSSVTQFANNAGMPIDLPEGMIPAVKTGTLYISGGEIAHGLGWAILLLGLAAAAIPYFSTNLEAVQQRNLVLAALSVGSFLILYLLAENFRHLHVGLVLAAVGYALQFHGVLHRENIVTSSAADAVPNHA